MDKIEGTKNSPQVIGKASEGSDETSPKADAKTHTQEQLDKAVQVALTKAGRSDKDFEEREVGLTAREAVIADREGEQDRIALEEARTNPAKMTEYQRQQAEKKVREKLAEDKTKLKAERAELEADKVKNAALVEAAQATQYETTIYEVAALYGINPANLKADAATFELKTEEQIKTYAQRLTGKEPPEPDPKKKKTVDSGVTSGSVISAEGKTSRQIFSDVFAETQKKK